MRRSSLVLISVGSLLGAATIFLLLFWFAFPRWWPEMVIGYSPSLRHVLETTAISPVESHQGDGTTVYRLRPLDLTRFEARYGDGVYAAIVSCDDGTIPGIRYVIMMYAADHWENTTAQRVFGEYFKTTAP